MLKFTNQYWSFDSQEELNTFLDGCMTNPHAEFLIERYGKSQKGTFYAFGSVVPTHKFSKENAESKTDDVSEELNLG